MNRLFKKAKNQPVRLHWRILKIGMTTRRPGSHTFPRRPWCRMGWLVFGLSIGAVMLLMVLIREGAVSKVASLFYLVPGVTALMAYALFDETLSLFQIAGMALTTFGVALAVGQSRFAARPSK